MPERAAALLRRLDHGMQQKLHEAITQYSNREGRLLAATNKPGAHAFHSAAMFLTVQRLAEIMLPTSAADGQGCCSHFLS
jgi:hypothetical protein